MTMGYNGNNRGRTHRWSGVGDKRYYNWGLNLTARVLVAPIVILGELIKLENNVDTSTPKYSPSYNTKSLQPPKPLPSEPYNLINSLIGYYPELSQRISILSKQKNELSLLKTKLKSVRYRFFLLGKRKRIISALEYKILRKEQFISSFHILEEKTIGKPIGGKKIIGKAFVIFSDQAKSDTLQDGIVLRKQMANFHKGLVKTQSLSLKSSGIDWQVIFYSKGLVLEDSNHILYVPYKDISVKETWVIHYADWDTRDYDIESSSWMYTRLDGGPDMRYSCNNRVYYVQRYQVEVKFKKLEKDASFFLIFQKKEDATTMHKIIAPKSKYDPEKIRKVKKYAQYTHRYF